MKRVVKKLKKSNRILRYLYYTIAVIYAATLFWFIKNVLDLHGIEDSIRTAIIIFFMFYLVLYIFMNFLKLLQRKYKAVYISSFIAIVFILIFCFGSYYIDMIYKSVHRMTESKELIYTSYLITLKDNEFDNNSIIGQINQEINSNDHYLSSKLYNDKKLNNQIESYDDYYAMINDLYSESIDAAFVPGNYVTLFSGEEGFETILEDTKVVYEISEKMENKDLRIVSDKKFDQPLTFLLLGVDSEKDGLNAEAAFNGDTLMVITFNPKTLNTVMVSLPRDTFVPITCRNNQYAKINSAAAYGTKCVIDTVNNFLDINIDYYVKVNFKGVVELVEALGGVDVEVEKPFYKGYLGVDYHGKVCEQDSNRRYGEYLVCMDPGMQHLNGEQALAYARNRHLYAGGDLDRVKHQQQVVEAISSKVLKFNSLSEFEKILKAISNNIATNMETDTILSGYEVVKSLVGNVVAGGSGLNISKGYLETYGLGVYIPAHKNVTSALGYYDSSLKAIQKALKVSLDLESEDSIKSFNYSVNETYAINSPGKGLRKDPVGTVLPNFVGKSVKEVESFCNANNISLTVKNVDPGDANYNDSIDVGLVGNQSVHEKVLLLTVQDLTVYVVNSKSAVETVDNSDETDDTTDSTTDEEIIENLIDN